ncbi:MAG: hypothetical protein O3B65_02190 [Chloroflexi bacterium]|nr:hypothetical protein [Chloroflexota bacterium]
MTTLTMVTMVLILASPFIGAAVAWRAAMSGHLRDAGGLALVALVTFGSVGLASSALLVTGEIPDSDLLHILEAFAGIGVAALTAAAIYAVDQGFRRRLLLVSAGLLLPTAVGPLVLGLGLLYIIVGWTVYFTLAIYNPQLRMSEVSLSG